MHFVWAQFSELNRYFKKQAEDPEKLNGKLAEMISLLTCDKNSGNKKGIKCNLASELKEILKRVDTRIRTLYAALPTNAMIIVCTGHGDIATVYRYVRHCTLIITMLSFVCPLKIFLKSNI